MAGAATANATSTLDFGLLGELQVRRARAGLRLGGRQQRAVLGLLLVEADQVVSVDRLADALWGERVPNGSVATLQTYVSHLRDILDPARQRGAVGQLLVTEPGGYRLRVPASSIDAAVFEQRARTGQALLDAEHFADASAELTAALMLWRGSVLADLADYRFVQLAATRLDELRLGAIEARVAADLALGRHQEIVAELEELATANPLREQLHAKRMLALYRCGRQAEALACYTQLRESLAEELGIDPEPSLQQPQQAILRQDPTLALAPRPVRRHALPVPPNPLLGRERELDELTGLLRSRRARLVVLTGAGGSGKTRLALEVAHQVTDSFANGAVFIPLAPLRDPDLMMAAIAQAVGARGAPAGSLDALVAVLHGQELLLVVDNVEQLRAATPGLVDLSARVPGMSLLVTSRAVLHLSGEQIYPVEPLPMHAAATLFVERAREAEPRFDAGDGQAVQDICERLDRLPLAIELAASRARLLTPGELLARLERRLPVLTGGPRDLPGRQQTLRATIEWSVELLDQGEQRDLFRLAVFAGGCTLQAAEAVCDITLDRLGTLIDQSLVRRLLSERGSRYYILETIREFAEERLHASGEIDETRRRHAEHFLAVAESANLYFEAEGEQHHYLAVPERDNIRAALQWALDRQEIEFALRLAVALEDFWVTSAPLEGAHWFEKLLLPRAAQLDPLLHAQAIRCYGAAQAMAGAPDRGEHAYEQSLAEFRALGDEHGVATLLQRLSEAAHQRGDAAQARRLAEESLNTARTSRNAKAEACSLGSLGSLACEDGDYAHGMDLLERSAAAAGDIGFWWWQGLMWAALAEHAWELGRTSEAESWCRQSLAVLHRLGDRQNSLDGLAFLARRAAATGRVEEAGRFWGAVEAEESRAPLGWWATDRERYASDLLAHRGAEFDRGLEEGRQMSLDEAVAYALDGVAALR